MSKSLKLKKIFLIISGSFFIFLGTIGIFIPILPTTPFILLAAACYIKSSEKLYNWLTNNRIFSKYIKNYSLKKGMTKNTKLKIILLGLLAIIISSFFTYNTSEKIILYSLGIIMIIVISLTKTAKE
ncbi:MAG TPA: YbaN family protein [Bacteroidota bacterium]|nr:YbaN family protein [Bacteroidota bacterium]